MESLKAAGAESGFGAGRSNWGENFMRGMMGIVWGLALFSVSAQAEDPALHFRPSFWSVACEAGGEKPSCEGAREDGEAQRLALALQPDGSYRGEWALERAGPITTHYLLIVTRIGPETSPYYQATVFAGYDADPTRNAMATVFFTPERLPYWVELRAPPRMHQGKEMSFSIALMDWRLTP
jgi:hypothetical protein